MSNSLAAGVQHQIAGCGQNRLSRHGQSVVRERPFARQIRNLDPQQTVGRRINGVAEAKFAERKRIRSMVGAPCIARSAPDGASLAGATLIVKVRVTVSTPPPAVPPSSFTVTVITALPDLLATGAYESEPTPAGLE